MSHVHFLFHIVFATKDRVPLIANAWEADLYRYLAGIIKKHGGELIAINGVEDHVHLLVKLFLKEPFGHYIRDLKASSSGWVRRNHQPKFSWQRRYGAFSVSESAAGVVRSYIERQKEHHKGQSFEDEYKALLSKHGIGFDERYMWE